MMVQVGVPPRLAGIWELVAWSVTVDHANSRNSSLFYLVNQSPYRTRVVRRAEGQQHYGKIDDRPCTYLFSRKVHELCCHRCVKEVVVIVMCRNLDNIVFKRDSRNTIGRLCHLKLRKMGPRDAIVA